MIKGIKDTSYTYTNLMLFNCSITVSMFMQSFAFNWQQLLHRMAYSNGRSLVFGMTGAVLYEPQTFRITSTAVFNPGHTFLSPNNSIYRHPSEYISTAVPLLDAPNNSGAIYGKVPMTAVVVVSCAILLAPNHKYRHSVNPWSPKMLININNYTH